MTLPCLSSISSSLSTENEVLFRHKFLKEDIKQVNTLIYIVLIPVIFLAYIDYSFYGFSNPFFLLLFMRSIFVLFSMAVLKTLSETDDVNTYDYAVLAWFISILALIVLIKFHRPPEFHFHLLFDLLAIMCSYMFINNRPAFQAVPSLSLSVFSITLFSLNDNNALIHILLVFMAFFIANLSGILVAKRIYKYKRENFMKEKKLVELLHTDPLTDISNRRHFYMQAQQEFSRANRYDSTFSIMLIDIDFFKKINDSFGHQVGDKYLKAFASLLVNSLRDLDSGARFGGEEFIALLPETKEVSTEIVAQRIRNATKLISFDEVAGDVSFSVSIGIAAYKDEDESIEDVISRADKALYVAKSSGRDCVRIAVAEVYLSV